MFFFPSHTLTSKLLAPYTNIHVLSHPLRNYVDDVMIDFNAYFKESLQLFRPFFRRRIESLPATVIFKYSSV